MLLRNSGCSLSIPAPQSPRNRFVGRSLPGKDPFNRGPRQPFDGLTQGGETRDHESCQCNVIEAGDGKIRRNGDLQIAGAAQDTDGLLVTGGGNGCRAGLMGSVFRIDRPISSPLS